MKEVSFEYIEPAEMSLPPFISIVALEQQILALFYCEKSFRPGVQRVVEREGYRPKIVYEDRYVRGYPIIGWGVTASGETYPVYPPIENFPLPYEHVDNPLFWRFANVSNVSITQCDLHPDKLVTLGFPYKPPLWVVKPENKEKTLRYTQIWSLSKKNKDEKKIISAED